MPVYIAQGQTSGVIKIGWSADPKRRLHSLKREAGEPMALVREIPGDHAAELWLVHYFAKQRVRGREWFTFSPDMLTVTPPSNLPVRSHRDGPMAPVHRLAVVPHHAALDAAERNLIRLSAVVAREIATSPFPHVRARAALTETPQS